MKDDETISRQLIYALDALTFVAARAYKPEHYGEIRTQEIRLNLILSRLELILSAVDRERPYKFRGRM